MGEEEPMKKTGFSVSPSPSNKKKDKHQFALTAKGGRKAFEGVTLRPGTKDKGVRMAGDVRSLPQRETYRLLAPPVVQRNSMSNLTEMGIEESDDSLTESTWREQTDSAR